MERGTQIHVGGCHISTLDRLRKFYHHNTDMKQDHFNSDIYEVAKLNQHQGIGQLVPMQVLKEVDSGSRLDRDPDSGQTQHAVFYDIYFNNLQCAHHCCIWTHNIKTNISLYPPALSSNANPSAHKKRSSGWVGEGVETIYNEGLVTLHT